MASKFLLYKKFKTHSLHYGYYRNVHEHWYCYLLHPWSCLLHLGLSASMLGLIRSFLLLSAAHQCLAYTLLYSSRQNSSYAFLQQLRIHDYTKTICSDAYAYPRCDIDLKRSYNATSRHLKTIDTLKTALATYPNEQVFFMVEDGILPDIDYISEVAETIQASGNSYWGAASNCSVRKDGSGVPVCMQEDFYGLSRPIASCFVQAASNLTSGTVNQSSFFGDTIYQHCKDLNISYKYRNESLIWKKVFHDMNKCVNLNFTPVTEKCDWS